MQYKFPKCNLIFLRPYQRGIMQYFRNALREFLQNTFLVITQKLDAEKPETEKFHFSFFSFCGASSYWYLQKRESLVPWGTVWESKWNVWQQKPEHMLCNLHLPLQSYVCMPIHGNIVKASYMSCRQKCTQISTLSSSHLSVPYKPIRIKENVMLLSIFY